MLQYPKTREEWLNLRHKYVSSTEVAALFGLSPYTTAFELGLLKQQPEPDPARESTERMEWGIRLQHAIAKGIAEKHGVKVRAISGYAVHSYEHCRMGASFDYEIVGLADDYKGTEATLRGMYTTHGAGILEIKNVDSLQFRQWETDDGIEAPAHIEVQVQHQLACIGRSWAAIGVLIGGNRLELLIREKDEAVNLAIAKRCEKFWFDMAKGILPPVELPADADIIAKLYKYAEPEKVYDGAEDAELVALAQEYTEAAEAMKLAESRRKTAKAKIILKIGNAERAVMPGYTVSAATVAECVIPSYTRDSYRNVRVSIAKPPKARKSKAAEPVTETVTEG